MWLECEVSVVRVWGKWLECGVSVVRVWLECEVSVVRVHLEFWCEPVLPLWRCLYPRQLIRRN